MARCVRLLSLFSLRLLRIQKSPPSWSSSSELPLYPSHQHDSSPSDINTIALQSILTHIDSMASSQFSTPSSNETSSPYIPEDSYGRSQHEDAAVWQRLYDNIKVIAVDNCPIHPIPSFCSCVIGLASLNGYNLYRTKVDSFIRQWDFILLMPEHGAYLYDGTQESHHAFQAKNNQTSKHFARAFAQNEIRSYMFGPAGKLQDLVTAMVEFWAMRTKMWKAHYLSADDVKAKWLPKVYDLSDITKMSMRGIADLLSPKAGQMLAFHEITFGPPKHACTAHLLPLDKVKKRFAVKICKIERCHEDCDSVLIEPYLKHAVQGMARSRAGVEVKIEEITYGTSAEMRRQLGMPPDPDAYTVEKDVLWVI